MKIENWDIDKIKPYAKNPRNNDDGVDAVANSIKEFGWQQPIVVDKDNVIIVGHTRYKAGTKKFRHKIKPFKVGVKISNEDMLKQKMLGLFKKYATPRPIQIKTSIE